MKNTTALQVFNFQEQQVRTIIINGVIWFVASDVCRMVGIVNVSDAISKLDEDEKLISSLPISGQNRQVLLVNESGLYHLIFQSRKEEARQFRRWVTNEVLPAIRKAGNYSVTTHQQEAQSLLEERLQRLEQEVEALKQVDQRPRLWRTKSAPASEEEVKVTKRVLVFLQRQEQPVSRRTLTRYGHACVAIVAPILDELVASGQVIRIKIPGSRVQWFYQLEDM